MVINPWVKAISALVLVCGCFQAGTAQSREVELPHSMKGYELYSWKSGGEWRFAPMVGTNRLKSPKEITSPNVRLSSLEALKRKLKLLPKGEEVSWSNRSFSRMAMPPKRIVEAVKTYCEGRGIRIRVAQGGADIEKPARAGFSMMV